MEGLTIKEAADRAGLEPGTIRMWEQRHGFPVPQRTPAGHRRYDPASVEALRRAVALRDQGLSVPAALERARAATGATDLPSIYAAIVAAAGMPVHPRALRKSTLTRLSRAIEDETMAYAAAPVCFAAFQRESFYRRVEHRYQRMACNSDATTIFADFPELRRGADGLVEMPIDARSALASEWAVVIDAPGYAACLVAWERLDSVDDPAAGDDGDRRFEALVSLDPSTVRAAARAAVRAVRATDGDHADRLDELLADRPLAFERPVPALTALMNRMLEYLDVPGV